jgi:DNA-binding transcriptional MerR regulator
VNPKVKPTARNGTSAAIDLTNPMSVRAEWLRKQGVSEEEIAELCDAERYPGDLEEELANLRSIEDLATLSLSDAELAKLAQRFPARARD